MTTTTRVTISPAAFVAASAGSTTVTVKGDGQTPFKVAVGNALPAVTAAAATVSDMEGYIAAFSNLTATDNVYVMGIDPLKTSVTVFAS